MCLEVCNFFDIIHSTNTSYVCYTKAIYLSGSSITIDLFCRTVMSRNTEKAQAALNRYQALKNKEAGVLESNPSLRPKNVNSVTLLPQAERWRSIVIGEISVKQTQINDPILNDYQIRDLNDAINKLLREKRSWEYRIRELGGPDYLSFGANMGNAGVYTGVDTTGTKVKGYRYFGRAKELPELKDIIAAQQNLKAANSNRLKDHEIKEKVLKERQARLTDEYYGLNEPGSETNNCASTKNIIQNDLSDALNSISFLLQDLGDNYKMENKHSDTILEFEDKRGLEILKLQSARHRDKPISDDVEGIVDFEKEVPTGEEVKAWIVQKKKAELINRLKIGS